MVIFHKFSFPEIIHLFRIQKTIFFKQYEYVGCEEYIITYNFHNITKKLTFLNKSNGGHFRLTDPVCQ